MQFTASGVTVRVFTISPRTGDPQKYWENIVNLADWSEQYGCTGLLLFTGNDTFIDPWVAAHGMLARTRTLAPLVAVNPIYMHPFTAAKMIMSLSRMYGRKVYLNLVTGTATSYLESLGDRLTHDDRYARLLEYGQVIRRLLQHTRPVTCAGRFYHLEHVQLLPGLPEALQPEFVLAGQSPAAREVCRALDAVGMQMLRASLDEAIDGVRGMHFGIVTRPIDADARRVAAEWFPESEEDRLLLDLSMRNTDSTWKRELHDAAGGPADPASPYWLTPFRNFKADSPYLVGDYGRVADVIARLIHKGIDTFIVDLPASEEEFRHVHAAFEAAAAHLRK